MPVAAVPAVPNDDVALSVPAAVIHWRIWSREVSEGGPTPPSRAVLDAAFLLNIKHPGPTLAADARVMGEVRRAQASADSERANLESAIDTEGGRGAIVMRIGEMKAEIQRLEGLIGPARAMIAGAVAAQVTGLKRRNPRLFDRNYRGEP